MLSYVPDGLVVSVPVAGAEPSHRDHRADGGRRFHASRQLRAAAEGEKVRTDDTNRRRLDHAHVRFVRYTRSLAPVRCVLGVLSQTVYSHQIYMSVDVYHDHRSQKKPRRLFKLFYELIHLERCCCLAIPVRLMLRSVASSSFFPYWMTYNNGKNE